jgi:hypothetical protein
VISRPDLEQPKHPAYPNPQPGLGTTYDISDKRRISLSSETIPTHLPPSHPLAVLRRGTSYSTRLRPSIPPRPNQSPCSCSTSPCPTRTTTEGAGPAALPDSLSLSATSSRPSEHPNVTIHHGSGFFDGDGGNICYIIFVMRLRQKIRRR